MNCKLVPLTFLNSNTLIVLQKTKKVKRQFLSIHLSCCKRWGQHESKQHRTCATAWCWTCISNMFMGYMFLENLRLQPHKYVDYRLTSQGCSYYCCSRMPSSKDLLKRSKASDKKKPHYLLKNPIQSVIILSSTLHSLTTTAS